MFPNSPTSKDPERGFALQKYLLLHSQHDALQKHLSKITSANASLSSQKSSLSSSPSDGGHLSTPPRFHQRSGSLPRPNRPGLKTRRSSLPAVIDESIIGEMEEDESRLKSVNQQIKSTLTDLLNCESVRGDRRYRMWVQTRLMDTEKELKRNRSQSCEKWRMSVDDST